MQAMLAGQQPAPAAAPTSGLSPVKWPDNLARNANTNTRFGPYKPIDKGEKGGLTDLQQNSLDRLVARYVAKTPSSKAYTAEHRPHYADPRAVSGFKSLWKEMVYPIVSQRTKNAKLWDIDGNEYVDITMGFGTYFFGHSPDWLIDAVEKQLRTGVEIGPQSPIAGKLAKAICELTGMERATFCNTGSEAVMAAMRLARTITGAIASLISPVTITGCSRKSSSAALGWTEFTKPSRSRRASRNRWWRTCSFSITQTPLRWKFFGPTPTNSPP
jgi:hypothetical protein